MSYENIYTGDLSKVAEQFKAIKWSGTKAATKKRSGGIPGQVSIVSSLAPVKFKEKPTGFLGVYAGEIRERRRMLHRRAKFRGVNDRLARFAVADEHFPPRGQAYGWYQEVIHYVPLSGMHVAKQIARLCGDDSTMSISQRSLADAVGRVDKLGRERAYTERGVQALVDAGWLRVNVKGAGTSAISTYFLQVGDTSEEARKTAQSRRDHRSLYSQDDLVDTRPASNGQKSSPRKR